jgi:protein-S-isoprenylcysteine O-methyltransferase Ste14
VAWGCAILACVAVYAWATISFGVRFSNLSHRGVITSGPYRWLRHPAYVAKNVSWWLIAVPFFYEGSPVTAVRGCLLLLGLNGVYALRAWTEERHLAQDPTYRAYQAWIDDHGLAAKLRRGLRRAG